MFVRRKQVFEVLAAVDRLELVAGLAAQSPDRAGRAKP